MHIKRGDTVIVTTGKDRGEKGEVLEVDHKHSRVKVHRRNMIKKHKKPNALTGEAGSRVDMEGWIHASTIALYSKELDGPVRTASRWVGDGGALYANPSEAKASFAEAPSRLRKVRVAAKTGEVFDKVTG
jgi:large subunit ribosomal protein L24